LGAIAGAAARPVFAGGQAAATLLDAARGLGDGTGAGGAARGLVFLPGLGAAAFFDLATL